MLYNPTPFEILLEEFLEPKNITVSTFAQDSWISVDDCIALLSGKKSITSEVSNKINTYLHTSFNWVGMQEDYEQREKDHQARRDIVQSIRDIEYILSDYVGCDVQLWIHVKEEDDDEVLQSAGKKAIQVFEKIMETIAKKEEYLEQKKKLEKHIQAYEASQKATK